MGDQASTRAALAALPGPLPRPPRPGEVASALDPVAWPAASPPYRLPVAGKLVTGLGELSDAGVRSRGLTIVTQPGAAVIAPAAGRVAYAGPFRSYGTIVILDHGGGWTTLVTGLGATSVAVGAQVAQGAAIGSAPRRDDPQVTVELRRRDRSVDMVPLSGCRPPFVPGRSRGPPGAQGPRLRPARTVWVSGVTSVAQPAFSRERALIRRRLPLR